MIIYFSGPHGAGKSSLIRGICNYSPEFVAYPDRLMFAHVDEPYLRQKSKIAKIFQEYCDQLNFEEENKGKIVLGDRCIYDCLIYAKAYERLGWITKEQNISIKDISEKFFDCFPSHLVVLNPPLECLVEHIKQRWKKGKKKWREENFQYLKTVYEKFEKLPDYFSGKNLLYINDKLKVEQEIDKVVDWMTQKKILKGRKLEAILV